MPCCFRRVLLIALVAQACSRERSPSRVAGAAEAAESGPRPPAPTLSRFDVPLQFDFTPVLSTVERSVPQKFGSLLKRNQIGTDTRRHYAFEATRGPFTVFAVGKELRLRTTLSYQARGYYNPKIGPTVSAGCGKSNERPRVVVELATPLTLTENWHLSSRARLARLAPATDSGKDRCQVSILQLDVTDRVVEAARQSLTTRLPDIDRQIARIDLTSRANGWWEALNRPIRLSEGVWLELQPERLRVGRITGERRILTVEAGMDAFPRIVTGPEPHREVHPLPPLGRDTIAGGFQVMMEGHIDYETASRATTTALRGRTITKGGRSVTVQSITAAADKGGKLALTLRFEGDANGTLKLVGTPRYDRVRSQIFVPDLDYDLSTDSKLIDVYAWIRSDSLRAQLREKAQVPVTAELERGRALLMSGLNRTIAGTMTLAATVDSIDVRGLYVTRAGLVIHAGASGNASVSIKRKRQ